MPGRNAGRECRAAEEAPRCGRCGRALPPPAGHCPPRPPHARPAPPRPRPVACGLWRGALAGRVPGAAPSAPLRPRS
ncbi:unnamed protein product, partial [Coccothraustes coccothraustes]